MAIRWYPTGGKRFYVIDVLGYAIRQGRSEVGTPGPRATYAVLDRDDCHREVAVFEPRAGVPAERCKKRAYELAAQLNCETTT